MFHSQHTRFKTRKSALLDEQGNMAFVEVEKQSYLWTAELLLLKIEMQMKRHKSQW